MELSKNSFSCKLYMYAYNLHYYGQLPNSFCEYFKKLMLAYFLVIVSSPLILIGFIADKTVFKISFIKNATLNEIDPCLGYSCMKGVLFIIMLFALLILFSVLFTISTIWFFPFMQFKELYLSGFITIFAALVAYIMKLYIYGDFKNNIFVAKYKSFKEKNCPKIDWTE